MKRIASLVALTMFATVGTATPAFAAQCRPGSCNGLDPQTTQCVDDARNVASFRYSGGNSYLRGALMELRHSRTCDAAWVRTTDGDCLDPWRPCGAVLEVRGGITQSVNPRPGQRWTNMWSYRYTVRGCFTRPNPSGDGYTTDQCTAWK